jgi:hypothetical protein
LSFGAIFWEKEGGGFIISLYNHIINAENTTPIYTKPPRITSFPLLTAPPVNSAGAAPVSVPVSILVPDSPPRLAPPLVSDPPLNTDMIMLPNGVVVPAITSCVAPGASEIGVSDTVIAGPPGINV